MSSASPPSSDVPYELLYHTAHEAFFDGQYDRMLSCCVKIFESQKRLTLYEQLLLQDSFRRLISPRRAEWQKLHQETDTIQIEEKKPKKVQLGKEIRDICKDYRSFIEEKLLTVESNPWDNSSVVLCKKVVADSYRYAAEVSSGPVEKSSLVESALDSYKKATELSKDIPYF
jgi:hypothetical protein